MNPAATQTLQLHDIHAAPPPPLWPPAPGWWVLASVVLAVLVFAGVRLYRRHRLRRQRKRILAELQRLDREELQRDTAAFTTAVSTLLRRVALMRYPRRRVAPLSGEEWLRFLDQTGGGGRFRNGPGRVLGSGPYLPRSHEIETAELLRLAAEWIEKNLGETDES